MIGLLFQSLKNQWSAQMRKPVEFLIGLFMLILNNSFYLYGIYLLAVISSDNRLATQEYLVSTGIVLISWGILNVFGGGLYHLADFIESGEIDVFFAKPKPILFLAGISKSNLISLGEIIQGITTLIIGHFVYDDFPTFRMLLGSIILVFGFAGVIIGLGSISFFTSRGSQLSYAILQVLLSLSLFPVSRALKGKEQWILYLTPLVVTATMPKLMIYQGGIGLTLAFAAAALTCCFLGIKAFQIGLKAYQSKNYIGLNG